MKLFLSPHNDDEALFGAFTLIANAGDIILAVVYDSHKQWQRGTGITAGQRREETREACAHLGVDPLLHLRFLGLSDADDHAIGAVLDGVGGPNIEHVYAPAFELGGHPQHNRVGSVADQLWPDKVTHYMTYTPDGKSTSARRVPHEPEWLIHKWRALACYKSQITLENTHAHFAREQYEFYQT